MCLYLYCLPVSSLDCYYSLYILDSNRHSPISQIFTQRAPYTLFFSVLVIWELNNLISSKKFLSVLCTQWQFFSIGSVNTKVVSCYTISYVIILRIPLVSITVGVRSTNKYLGITRLYLASLQKFWPVFNQIIGEIY